MTFNVVAGDAQVIVLADCAVEACLHVVFTLIAGVNKAVLALVVQLHQHAHGAPLGPPEGAELQVLVPGQSQEGITAVHQVTGHHGVQVNDWGQGVGSGAGNEADDKENLLMFLHSSVEFLRKVIGNIGHPWFLLVGSAQAALVLARLFIVLLFGILAVSFCDIGALIGGAVLLPLSLLFLLLKLLDTLLQDIGPEVTLKIWQLLGTGQPVLCCLLENVLVIMDNALRHSLVQHLFVPLLQALWLWDLLV